jgi:hypothetical protein
MKEFLPEPQGEEPDNSEPHYVRKVTLPSGKVIEVVYFDEDLSTTESGNCLEDLTICKNPNVPDCKSGLVYPVEWDEAGTTHWEVTLRCPNCEWTNTGVVEQAVVEKFDEALDGGTEALVRDLKRMIHANMEDEIERFVEALNNDHILPEDF